MSDVPWANCPGNLSVGISGLHPSLPQVLTCLGTRVPTCTFGTSFSPGLSTVSLVYEWTYTWLWLRTAVEDGGQTYGARVLLQGTPPTLCWLQLLRLC
jgi:hypothetical protein